MRKCLILSVIFINCTQKQEQPKIPKAETSSIIYSTTIADSFSIFIHLPADYNENSKTKYPVAYLLDANLYFDIIAATLKKYSEVGLSPDVILVGVGYKNIELMDSLRNRDYTYPLALPEYDMNVSGAANKFLSFLEKDVVPMIEKEYRADTSDRILLGHSLGGYFTTYALLQNLLGENNCFNSYIAASPSLHYNNYFLLEQLREVRGPDSRSKKIKAYITFGGSEDKDNSEPGMIKLDELSARLQTSLGEKQTGVLKFKSDIFSNLDHIDTPIPTFLKGLQWTLDK